MLPHSYFCLRICSCLIRTRHGLAFYSAQIMAKVFVFCIYLLPDTRVARVVSAKFCSIVCSTSAIMFYDLAPLHIYPLLTGLLHEAVWSILCHALVLLVYLTGCSIFVSLGACFINRHSLSVFWYGLLWHLPRILRTLLYAPRMQELSRLPSSEWDLIVS